jgi:thymidylate synthase
LQAWDGKIDMTAVYRNHDYFNKALPNFVGLGRLLDFICSESGRDVGKLVCHSGHAYFSKSRAAAVSLIARV